MEQNTVFTPVTRTISEKFGNLELTCEKCTESERGGHILKLVHKSEKQIITPFGKKTQPIQHTFYMKVNDAVELGVKHAMNIDDMKVVGREYKIIDTNTGEVTIVELKWLQIA